MSGSMRWLTSLSLAALTLASGLAFAQRRPVPAPSPRQPGYAPSVFGPQFNPNPMIAPGLSLQQATFNTAVLGKNQAGILSSVGLTGPNLSRVLSAQALGGGGGFGPSLAPYALNTGAINPFVGGVGGASPFTSPTLSPFGLSTVGGGNPYTGGSASLAASPYGSGASLSTVPSSGSSSGYGSGYGYGFPPGDGATLLGVAAYTDASGKYWINIQQARLMREQSRQASLETQRKEIEFLRWWDSVRPTAPKMRDQEMATDLDRARKAPSATEVWSGKSLNELLRSIQNPATRLNRGPNLELAEDLLKHVNLTDSSGGGSVGMLRDGGKLTWPLSLQESQFDKARRRLTGNLLSAVDQLKNKEPVERATLKDIISDFQELNKTLASSADELSPAQYIEAKRYLNQLSGAVRALADPKVINYFNNTWNAKGKNVAELVSHMTKEGLQFAPVAPGDEAAYNALYQALRAFEAGVQTVSR